MLKALTLNRYNSRVPGEQHVQIGNVHPYRAVIDLLNANVRPQMRSFWLQCALEYFMANPRKIVLAIAFWDQWSKKTPSKKIGMGTTASVSREADQAFYDFLQLPRGQRMTRDELISILWVAACHENMFPGIHEVAATRSGLTLKPGLRHKQQMVVSTYREPALAGAVARKGRR